MCLCFSLLCRVVSVSLVAFLVAPALLDGSPDVSHGGDVEAKAWVGVPGPSAHGGDAEARVVAPDPVTHGGDGDV